LVLLSHYNYQKRFIDLVKSFEQDIEDLAYLRKKEDEELRIKQEKEMQEANLKRLQLDLIVNRHIEEINKFNCQSEEKLIKLISLKRDNYLQNLENIFQEFYENIKSTDLIYNSENKLVQIKYKKLDIIQHNSLDKAQIENNNLNYSNIDSNSNLMNLNQQGI